VDQRRQNPWTGPAIFGFSRRAMRRIIIPWCLEPFAVAILTVKRDVR
jgi:hypothetical protein